MTSIVKSLWLLLFTLVICCLIYPLVVWAIGQTFFPFTSNGSMVNGPDGKAVGSLMIAQPFTFVEERSFERVGGGMIKVDVRLIAASNRNLEAEAAAGRFRQDLFYRINVIAFSLPPLRDRPQDILPLASAVLTEISTRLNRLQPKIAAEAAEALARYRWPGNLRELHNVLERAAILRNVDTLTVHDLPDSIRHPAAGARLANAHEAKLEDLEREHILHVLAESETLEQAAVTLGIASSTLWRKRKQYGIN
jgi:transcriptional regulator with PAS, ATPase and Fis domain